MEISNGIYVLLLCGIPFILNYLCMPYVNAKPIDIR